MQPLSGGGTKYATTDIKLGDQFMVDLTLANIKGFLRVYQQTNQANTLLQSNNRYLV
jgi:hypothetical protein